MPTDLKSFLEQRLKGKVVNTFTKQGTEPNFVEGFVIETNTQIGGEEVLNLLRQHYGCDVCVREESYHWIIRRDEVLLLVIVTNLSGDAGGSRLFGGSHTGGAIDFKVTQHPEL